MPSNAIPKRKLGDTGLEVTVLGMGGAPLGGLFQVRGAAISLLCLYVACCTHAILFPTAWVVRVVMITMHWQIGCFCKVCMHMVLILPV